MLVSLAQIGLVPSGLELAGWGEAAAPSRGPCVLSRISGRFAVTMGGAVRLVVVLRHICLICLGPEATCRRCLLAAFIRAMRLAASLVSVGTIAGDLAGRFAGAIAQSSGGKGLQDLGAAPGL
jgi:hypothetical protein